VRFISRATYIDQIHTVMEQTTAISQSQFLFRLMQIIQQQQEEINIETKSVNDQLTPLLQQQAKLEQQQTTNVEIYELVSGLYKSIEVEQKTKTMKQEEKLRSMLCVQTTPNTPNANFSPLPSPTARKAQFMDEEDELVGSASDMGEDLFRDWFNQ
jgi:hypothetical protein